MRIPFQSLWCSDSTLFSSEMLEKGKLLKIQIWRSFYCRSVHTSSRIISLLVLLLVENLFPRYLAISIVSAQNPFSNPLLINFSSFMMIIVHHPYSPSPFSFCTYGATYFIEMPYFHKTFEACLILILLYYLPLVLLSNIQILILLEVVMLERYIWSCLYIWNQKSSSFKYVCTLVL